MITISTRPYSRRNRHFLQHFQILKEGGENRLVLRDINNTAFQHVVHWLYTGRFSPTIYDSPSIIIKTYAVADRLMMTRCKNMAMDSLRNKFSHSRADISHLVTTRDLGYSASHIIASYIIEQTTFEAIANPSRHLEGFTEELFLEGSDLAAEFVRKLVEKARPSMPKYDSGVVIHNKIHNDPALQLGCVYHEHAEGEKCYLLDPLDATG